MPDQQARTMDPPFTGRFVFSVGKEDEIEIGAFTECSGLSVDIEVEELKEGGQNQFVHKLPGRMTWPNIVLKRGITNSDNLFEWLAKCSGEGFAGESNRLARQEGEVALLDPSGKKVRKWEFEGAFPVKWSGPTLAAGSRDAATEQLEIAHHGFRASSG
jgi:phage tail-like protein